MNSVFSLATAIALSVSLFSASSWSAAGGADAHAVIDFDRAALVITDPQNDFLHHQGAAYGLLRDNLEKLNTIDNIAALFKAAKQAQLPVFVSPHGYFEHDEQWQHRGPLQQTMHSINMFDMNSPAEVADDITFGADFLERYKPYILDGKTVITSPHKVFGPESNDLVLQLRKRGIDTVILGGMAANLCTDSHMRELIEQGFKVYMVKDAVGAPGEEAYQAALVNYGLIANGVLVTTGVVDQLQRLRHGAEH